MSVLTMMVFAAKLSIWRAGAETCKEYEVSGGILRR